MNDRLQISGVSVVPVDASDPTVAERLRAIRGRLPGQVTLDHVEAAALAYGPLYTRAQIIKEVAEMLAPRMGYRRGVESSGLRATGGGFRTRRCYGIPRP